MNKIPLIPEEIVDGPLGVTELRGKIDEPIMSWHEVGCHFITVYTKNFPYDAKKLYLGETKLLER